MDNDFYLCYDITSIIHIKEFAVRKGIHPQNYREVLFYDTAAQQGWVIRSCTPTTQTMVWTDGQTYPVMMLDTSSASHPVYTGKQRSVDTMGRASRFHQRHGQMLAALHKRHNPSTTIE